MTISKEPSGKYTTPDLYQAAMLSLLLKTNPEFQVSGSWCFFKFKASPEVARAVEQYHPGSEGLTINAYELARAIKSLRLSMFQVINSTRRYDAASGRGDA